MKKLLVAVTAVLLMSSPALAWGPSLIGGAGVGKCVTGPDDGETFVTQYAGAKLKDVGNGAVYACYQHASINGVTGVGGDGAKLIFAASFKKVPCLSTLFGVGFLSKLQPNGDSYDAGLTVDAGISWDVSDWMDVAIHGTAWDRGSAASWPVMLLFTVKDPQILFPGWGGK